VLLSVVTPGQNCWTFTVMDVLPTAAVTVRKLRRARPPGLRLPFRLERERGSHRRAPVL
jgi:hypothetical protein